MTAFSSPLDICNAALDKVGANALSALTDTGKASQAVNRAYDKARRAELRRNVWRFATRKALLRAIDTTTIIIQPSAWDATVPYAPGQIVSYNGAYYVSQSPNNLNNTPGQGTDAGLWEAFFGPLTVSPFDSTLATSYFAGEHVYETKGVNKLVIFSSLISGNANDPGVVETWSSTSTYNRNNVVLYNGFYYLSLIDRNLNNTPGTYGVWQASLTYAKEAAAYSTVDGFVYKSLIDSNKGNEPSATAGIDWNSQLFQSPWASAFRQPVCDLGWVAQAATESPTEIIYPLGSGPLSQIGTLNAFRLPNGYLKTAPQDPTAGSFSYLGAPSNLSVRDWKFEGNYIVSWLADPIPFRFVADVTDVSSMDDMFCQMLACRIALEICEALTQSTSKLEAIASEYKRFGSEARGVNGIETGPTEPPLDDYLACRF